ncbi:hypothetical protein A6D6_01705 [Alcanivorax xiamenensis]|uniref:DUF1461 domain-containing protein n=1 Tax=Alcanivorax xiamenensis TaxID=1177156 RepID=A0ABQ6Y9P4_9GAMM|nr:MULTISPECIES: DUF1461 domain-containing protein [Alcanivorax]KAF0806370.1 hypothetical protein A6D6_01705 [Alcanivorax xiamenensis]
MVGPARGAASLAAWWLYTLNAMILALGVSWGLYSLCDYGYAFWYPTLDIEGHIQEYGPQNRYRRDFERLEAEQYQTLFHEIRQAVHDNGEGLEAIHYPNRLGEPVPLLRQAEILHLKDVAHLIRLGTVVTLIAACLWWPLALLVRRQRRPSRSSRALALAVPLLGLALWLAVAGPEAVFYQFHIWLFPPEHEWFFYWQDSLMSTLMKAPVLFGGIALVLSAGVAVLTPVIYFTGLRLAGRGSLAKA